MRKQITEAEWKEWISTADSIIRRGSIMHDLYGAYENATIIEKDGMSYDLRDWKAYWDNKGQYGFSIVLLNRVAGQEGDGI